MTDWLQQRLTRVKKQSQRWLYLAQTLEKIWVEFFDPYCTKLENLRSGYLMDDEDLAKKMRELGDVVVYELKNVNRPISIAWRHLELTYKEQMDIFSITAKRVIGHTNIEMCPYFAPVDKEYGTEFKTYKDFDPVDESKKYTPPDGYFLTSRVLFVLSWDDFAKRGYTAEQFMKNFFPLIESVKPLHITCRSVTTTSNETYSYEYIAFSSVVKTSAEIVLRQSEDVEIPMTEYRAFAVAESTTASTVVWNQGDIQTEFPLNFTVGTGSVVKTSSQVQLFQDGAADTSVTDGASGTSETTDTTNF